MTQRLLLAVILCARVAHAAPTTPAVMPATPEAWRQAALADIAEAYQITLDNHAGTYDPYNPGFIEQLNQAKQHSLALANRVQNGAGYEAVLQDFTAGIHDGHAGVIAQLPDASLPAERWPGFVTVWRQHSLYIYAALPDGPPQGAQVISCDGAPINDVIRSNVFAFKGKVEDAGDWWSLARLVFVDDGNPFIKLPSTCVFVTGGVETARVLHWTVSTKQTQRWRDDSYNGDVLPTGLSEPAIGLYWAAMPTFTPNEQERDAYRSMTREVHTNRQRYLDARAIVVDLRDNMGGASAWSLAFASALWGEARVRSVNDALDGKTQVWWRASAPNTAYMAKLADTLAAHNQDAESVRAKRTGAAMQTALDNGQRYYIEKTEPAPQEAWTPGADIKLPAYTKPVYVIMPGQCVSACLDAVDVFSRFANTTLIGAPTGSDSNYMEVRHQTLSSGRAFVIVPIKVYRNRTRGGGQIYKPAIYVTDVNWSTQNFLGVIEQDLARTVHTSNN